MPSHLVTCCTVILWYICSKQELWSQINSHHWWTALKQHSFLGIGYETNNRTAFIARPKILNKQEQKAAAREGLSRQVPTAMDMHATGEQCFLHGLCKDVISKGQDSVGVARVLSWKGTAIQKGRVCGSQTISIVRSRYQETSSNRLTTLLCNSDV
jgi:hypothetical protein